MNKVYLITDFGAVADNNEIQTEKIQKAIDECFKNGGGTVVVPDGWGRTFFGLFLLMFCGTVG